MRHALRVLVQGCALAALVTSTVRAQNIVQTLPAFNGGSNYPFVWPVGTFNYTIPSGHNILWARISGQFGNSVVSSTAAQDLYLDGIKVASCAYQSPTCWQRGPELWSYNFSSSEFGVLADGSASFVSDQTNCCVVRLGATTLEIQTQAVVPEPSTVVLLAGGLVGMLAVVRRRQRG